MSDGCAQGERFPAGLAEGRFQVDEADLAARLAVTAGLGEHLRFFDLQQGERGTWGELFHSDEALALACIAGLDAAAWRQRMLREAETAPLPDLARQLLAAAELIDGWYKALAGGEPVAGRRLCARIAQLVGQPLAGELAAVLADFGDAPAAAGMPLAGLARQRLDPIWFPAARTVRLAPAQRPPRDLLRGRLLAFASAIEQLQALARTLLPDSLSSQRHRPAAGLLLAFAQLYGVAQQRINRFTARHADFYYDDCLQMRPLPAQPDRLHLVCQRDLRTQRDVVVPRGALFDAGKDAAGRPVVFRADDALRITDAQVAALHTLRLHRDPLISPECELGYVTRIEAARLDWPPAAPLPADAPPPHWALFGGAGAVQAGVGEEARIGLAIASPLLALREGQRQIILTLGLEHPAEADARLPPLAVRAGASPRAMRRLLPVLVKRYLLQLPELLAPFERSEIDALATRLASAAQARQAHDATVRQGADEVQPTPGNQRPPPGCYELFIVEFTVQAPTAELFHRRLGRLFSRWLLADGDWLTPGHLRALRETAARLLGPSDREPPGTGDPRCLIQPTGADLARERDLPWFPLQRPSRALMFGQLFNGLFGFSVTTPTGWLALSDYFVSAAPLDGGAALAGLQVTLRLRPQDPPVVGCQGALHGTEWGSDMPLLSLRLQGSGRLYPYSLLEDLKLAELTLQVQVRGVRTLVLHNQLGRLDAGKPFMPFGPLPDTASYLAFGAPEAAAKNVTALTLQARWAGLPADEGGMAAHYAGYGSGLRNEAFTATPAILRDGRWHEAAAPGALALFETADAGGRLGSEVRWAFPEAALRTHASATHEALDEGQPARNGWYRLQLAGPAMAFGHAAYPALLTEVVRDNATVHRKQPRPPPNPPYTPLIEQLQLDYSAQSHLVLGRESDGDAATGDERVLHLHPFGVETVHPADGGHPTLLPQAGHDGNLFIGLRASALDGTLTLHFHLRDEDAVPSPFTGPRPPLQWACLAGNRWLPLQPSQVVADTTAGLLTSGIVTLDVPAAINRDNTVLDPALWWLRLSADARLETHAGLYAVRAQALAATRVLDQAHPAPDAPLPAGSVKGPVVTLPGLAAVLQVGPSFGLRAAEDRARLQARAGERLQHKQRASTPWDIERLVLAQYPSVLKVRCFPHLSMHQPGIVPGAVLVVVVPRPHTEPPDDDDESAAPRVSATAAPHCNAIELAQIAAWLAERASPHARISVRNASFERVQVRCTVQLAPGAQGGRALRRINQAIVDYVSPWREPGYGPDFDWTVRCEDVEAHLRTLDCVSAVTQVSLLHVAQSDSGVYTLDDTARAPAAAATRVRPRSPWSIVLPMREHIVTTVDRSVLAPPQATGINRLGIGNTFILGRAAS